MNEYRRIIDANANRAREAARVMEEAARFVLDDPRLARSLKQWRHDLAAAIRTAGPIEFHRDTPGDVGTRITAEAEKARGSVADVVIAAGKRLGEALRVLEEYGKLVDVNFAAAVKQLRYRAYTIEQQLITRIGSGGVKQWRVCVLITAAMCIHHRWDAVARAALDAGADCLQLREKSLDGGELLERASALVDMAGRKAAVIVNDRPDIALLAGATGVHVGQSDLPVEAVRKIAGRQLAVGVSTHNLGEARAAVRAGADYCGVGAMFATDTKARRPSGVKYLQQFLRKYPAAVHLAIGGITPGNIGQLVDAGARGVAVSSIVCAAEKPGRVVQQLVKAF